MCVDITKTFFTQNVVVQNFESHGIRTLARATRRQNFSSNEKYHQQKVERPLIPDDINIKEVMEEDRAKNRGYSYQGHKNYLAAGDAIYTEGNFVTWDLHAPASVKMEIEKILGEHNDVIKFSILDYNKANPGKKPCEGWEKIDYEEEMANKAGMIHPQRVQPYRQYTPNEFSNQDGMPHIMSVNKQFGGNKYNPSGFHALKRWGAANRPGNRSFYTEETIKELL